MKNANQIPEPIVWIYQINKSIAPSENVARFIKLLSTKDKIRFISDTPFKKSSLEDGINKKYNVIGVSVIGNVNYVNEKVKESFGNLQRYLDRYVNSDESFDNKIYELSAIKIRVKEFLFRNDLQDPVFLEIDSVFDLFTSKWDKKIVVRWEQCNLNPSVHQELLDHIHLRKKYAELLYSLCTLYLDKLTLIETRKRISDFPEYPEMERKITQVWLAMDLCGFMDNLNADEKAFHRKEFLKLFNLNDDNYNDISSNLRKIKNPKKSDVVREMLSRIEKYFKAPKKNGSF